VKCKICGREAEENGFCPLHLRAYHNVLEKFEPWKKASGLVWIEYLVEIQKNSLTGEWAKEVVEHLIKDEDGNVK
jgi:hypothetical protein